MLRGVGAALSLPMLEVMGGPSLRATGKVRSSPRLAYLYFPNGVADGAWGADRVGQDGQLLKLNKWMAPLDPFMDQLVLFRNFWTPRGNGHGAGTATWLTGGAFNGEKVHAGGISVDQLAARHFQGKTLLPSLELATRGEGSFSTSLSRNSISWADASTPVPRDIEPRAVFDRMFRAGKSGFANSSVLDLVLEDARRLKRRVSHYDQHKLDEYLESVRAVERRIEFAQEQKLRAVRTPGLEAALIRPDSGIPQDHGEYLRTMMDILVLAFWADATRVATFMLDHGQSNRYFNFIDGVKGTWHALSHWRDFSGRTEDDDGKTRWSSRNEKLEMYNRVTTWHTEQVAYLLKRLSSIQETDGTLLDNSMIVYGSNLADGDKHADRNLPLILAGGGGGQIRQGRQVGGREHTSVSKLHLTLLQNLGVPQERFAETRTSVSLA